MVDITYADIINTLSPLVPNLPSDPKVNLIGAHYIDSMMIIEIVVLLEQTYGVAFDADHMAVEKFMSIDQIAKTVNALRKERT